jgi:hypothetical protein
VLALLILSPREKRLGRGPRGTILGLPFLLYASGMKTRQEVLKKMAKKQEKNSGKQPDIKTRNGIFQLSAWKTKKVIPAKNDYDTERVFERINICLSAGMRQDGKWKNVQAWFTTSQFGDLKATIDEFAEELQKANGIGGGGE